MSKKLAGREASATSQFPPYERHRPEQTLLYQLVERYYPMFVDLRQAQGRALPSYVELTFEAFLKCGRLEHGFLRVRCEQCHHEKLVGFSCKKRGFCSSCGGRRMTESAALLVDEVLPHEPMRQWVLSFPYALRFLLACRPAVMGKVLGIVYRAISTHLINKAGYTSKSADTGAVTLIQSFGSALNLNVHFHLLVLDGVYVRDDDGARFKPVKAPTNEELTALLYKISERVGRYLLRQGLLLEDAENSYLNLESVEEGAMDDLIGSSITYRIAVGAHQGRKAFTVQRLPPKEEMTRSCTRLVKMAGFSLHADVAALGHEREKLERLCRYITRPALSIKRLSLTSHGDVVYQLKTPYRDGSVLWSTK